MTRPLLHQRFPALRESLPHLSLMSGPSPVRRLEGLDLPLEVWLKDDGVCGEAGWGGNKIRKLEWIIPDAQRRGRRTILTFGATGTNHGLATALYGRAHGLDVALALVDQPEDDHVRAQLARLRRSGASIHRTRSKPRTAAALPWLIVRHRRPYVLGVGGSSPIGALGYVEGALELAAQIAAGELPEPSHVFVAVGSGGTAAGLALGLRLAGLDTRVVGVVVNDAMRLDHSAISHLARRSARRLQRRGAGILPLELPREQLIVTREFLGAGYGHSTPEATDAVSTLAEREDVRLDPVYTGKAMAGLMALARGGSIGPGPVLFVNTYGPRRDADAAP